VWEATVVPALADANMAYVTVDDYHFLCSGKRSEDLNGFFTTEEDDRKLDLFPISEALRYRIPFTPAYEVVSYLESLAQEGKHAAAIYFDDIEKFGIWPETYEWVYVKHWLEDFIRGVLASPHITTQTYRDYHAAEKTRGIVYLPTTSYIEMNEWTLPVAAAHTYADLVQTEKTGGHYDARKAFLRGGIWKNFFTRYPESNWMHKRMLSLSTRLNGLPEKKRTAAMVEQLYIAQANDSYWHGLFGGIYLPHLRREVYRAIVQLESMLDQVSLRAVNTRVDFDSDGCDELFLHNALLQVVIKLDGSASISEFDAYQLSHNFGDTLRRQPEHYFRKIESSHASHHSGDGIASPHERVAYKHEISAEDMVSDAHGQTLFRDGIVLDRKNFELSYELVEADSTGITFRAELDGVTVKKRIFLDKNRLGVSYRLSGGSGVAMLSRIALAMPSCDGFLGRYIMDGHVLGGFGNPLDLADADGLVLDDGVLGGNLHLNATQLVQMRGSPFFTVSQSEAGFEKIMQAVMLTLQWPGSDSELTILLSVNQGKI
jgi:hypothetical protein